MSAPSSLWPAALLLVAGVAYAQPPGIGPTARRELATGESLSAAVDRVEDGWVAWDAPIDRRRDLCCWSGSWTRRGCSLAERSSGFNMGEREHPDPLTAGTSPRFIVLLERRDGKPAQLWMVGDACPVRRDGESLTWLSGVAPEESLALVEGLARSGGDRIAESAVAALALHALPRATAVLEDLARSGASQDRRENAAFWLGEARGEDGYRALDRLLESGVDGELEEQIVFALSLSGAPRAHARLLQLAGEAERSDTRAQALFWLARSGAAEVEAALWTAAEQSADDDVREQAVFAMSQLPGGRAVDALLHALRRTRHPEVRRQALFWLAESDDPRALDEIERLLAE